MLRLMQSMKGWKIYDWPFIGLVSGFIIILILSLLTESDVFLINVLFIVTALLGSFVLFRMTKAHLFRIWQSAAGKAAIGLFSLFVVAGARILADYEIMATTGAPASLFPRAQDVLTLLFSTALWFNLAITLLALFAFISQVVLLIRLGVVKALGVKPVKLAGSPAFKMLASGFIILFLFAATGERVGKTRFDIIEHAIVWSSFVPNDWISFHLAPSPFARRLCPLQPKSARLALVKDDAVMVALPATPDRMQGAFVYLWGQCGNDRLR